MNRRRFVTHLTLAAAATAATATSHLFAQPAAKQRFRLNYLVGSSMYGELPLKEILPDIHKTGARHIDVWPRKHGNQREQMDAMGHDQFATLLDQHQVQLGCLTRYDLGPFGLAKEFPVARKFNCPLIVCGGKGPTKLKGPELKAAVKTFAQQLKPHLELARQNNVTLAIENHGNNLIDSPDSLKWLIDLRPSDNLKIALAPYHLENLGTNPRDLARLISSLGNNIAIFYAWQHGMGCMKKLPKEQELLQMPGRGQFDFAPAVQALKQINFQGFTEIFMHPVPRGIPILPTAAQTTAEIIRSRTYLENLL